MVYCAPLSPSTPLVLAPSSRPSSPTSPSVNTEHISLLAARLSDLDRTRRRLGPNHLGTWAAGLGGLESTALKGALSESPWVRKNARKAKDDTDEALSMGIPMNMDQWQAWERQAAEAKQKLDESVNTLAKGGRSAPHQLEQDDTTDSTKTMASNRLAQEEEDVTHQAMEVKLPIAARTSTKFARVSVKPDRTIAAAFPASKSTVSTSTSAMKAKPPRSGRRKSPSFPSPDTLNSAAESASPAEEPGVHGESWRSGERGAEEEILYELGCTPAALPTSTQQVLSSSAPRSTAQRQHFLSSPMPLPLQGVGPVAFTSTPHHTRPDKLSNHNSPSAEDDNRSDYSFDKNKAGSFGQCKPQLRRLSSIGKPGTTTRQKEDVEEEGREIEVFLGGERDSLDSR